MAERSPASEEKRQLILQGAVRAFARKGFHDARVGDIAAEAGVAHGLLYHYFESKEQLLLTVFSETWQALLEAVKMVEESGTDAREQIRRVAAIVLRTWGRDPDLVRVLVREVTRSPQLQNEVDEIGEALAAIERIVRGGQERGELRREIDARLAASIVYGALEEILTAWVLGQLPDGEEDVARAERAVVDILCDGLAPTVAAPVA
ncbi:MAG TPA: TetR/AcrR family transcriptional regulator [Gaiellaceae bacterium]|nr:TetR/AcrR family transcriptional regulator [Gaiellaceae bacterium]